MAFETFEKRIYYHIAWKALQENPSFNPNANQVIASNVGIRIFLLNHPPIRLDWIHPYIHCRRRCIYSILPHAVNPFLDLYLELHEVSDEGHNKYRPRKHSIKVYDVKVSSEKSSEASLVIPKVYIKQDEDQYCSVFTADLFPLTGDVTRKRVFEYWKNYYYDEEISAEKELSQAWDQVMTLQKEIGDQQDDELQRLVTMNDGTVLETSLNSEIFSPWLWEWKKPIRERPKKYSKKVLLKFDKTELENIVEF